MSRKSTHKNEAVKAAAIAGNLAVVALLINVICIPLLSPADGWESTSLRPEFSWGGLQAHTCDGFVFMLDEDPEFSSPVTKEVMGNSYRPEEPLEFGTYFWKVVSPGCATSPTGMFTVVSEVAVKRDDGWLKNTGNSAIAFSTSMAGREPAKSARPGFTGLFIGAEKPVLGINQTVEIGGNEDVIAEML